ncbi:MAG: C45 family autoproteolytic acyltransferase/hydrolase [Planctomycetota bacterium]
MLFGLGFGCSRSSSSGGSSASTVAPSTSRTTTPGSTTPPPPPPPPKPSRTKTAKVIARAGEGFLEEQNGRRLLHVKGSAYERGRQYGELVGDEVHDILQRLYGYAATLKIPQFVVSLVAPLVPKVVAPLYKPYYPQDVLDSFQGIVDGAARRSPPIALSIDELVFMNAIIDLGAMANLPIFKCSGHAVWGPRTKGGKMYQLRNVDLLVGSGLEEHALAVIEKPDGGKTFLNAGWAGLLGSASGMNEHGIGISQVWGYSWDSNIGQPWILTNRGILSTAENVDGIHASYASVARTYGSNFVFADRGDGRGGQPRAIALESTHADLASFDANDPREDANFNGIDLCIKMPFAVMRGDTAMCQRIRNRQYIHPDPRGSGGYDKRYKQQADLTKDYEAKGVLMGQDEMITISRQIAMPGSSLQCVVYENTDLVVHVANSRVTAPGQAIDANVEPFERWDLDYYLPTVAATPDKASYTAGDTIQLTLSVSNRGRARDLEVRATLVGPGGVKTTWTQRATVKAATGQAAKGALALALPATAPKGPSELVVELLEAHSDDVVDFARTEVTVK